MTDPAGRPLPGAYVVARAKVRKWNNGEVTGREGRCTLPVPAGEPLRLSSSWGELYSGGRGISLPLEGEVGLETLVLSPDHGPAEWEQEPDPELPPNRVLVRVLDASGIPVPGVEVDGYRSGSEFTDQEGTAVLPGEGLGTRTVFRVEVAGCPRLWSTATAGGPVATIRLPDRGSIRIRLDGERESPRSLIWLKVYSSELQRESFISDNEWGFTFDEGTSIRIDCPAGTWPVEFGADPGQRVFYRAVTVRAGEETALTYRFPQSSPLHVRVLDQKGEAVPNAKMVVAERMGMPYIADSTGVLVYPPGRWGGGLPAGPGHLLVYAKDRVPALHGPFDLWAPLRLDLRLGEGGWVRGRLVDPSGRPIEGQVGWQPAGGPLFTLKNVDEDDGTFKLWFRLPEGLQTLVAVVPGRALVKQVITVPRVGEVEVTIVVR